MLAAFLGQELSLFTHIRSLKTGEHSHFEEEALCLTQGRRLASQDSGISNQACDAGAEVCYGGEENEGVGDGPGPLEEAIRDDYQADANQAEGGAGPLDMLESLALFHSEMHVFTLSPFDFRRLHGEEMEADQKRRS